jgi:hypothetical protein
LFKSRIIVPTIKNDHSGYNQILKIAAQIFKNPIQHFDFDFKQCSKIEHNGVVMLGALARYVDFHNKHKINILINPKPSQQATRAGVMFLVDSMSSVVRDSLEHNNFLNYFTNANYSYPKGGYIGYREHTTNFDADAIAEHLEIDWLSADKLKLSPKLKNAILSRILEIFTNAYGHGVLLQPLHSLGVYSCGQYDSKTKKLNISVLDFGIGIVENVKKQTGITNDFEALNWALTRGNSTRTDSTSKDMARGLGFDLLNRFVTINEGELRIYSNNVQAISNGSGSMVLSENKEHLNGTLVSITIQCDDRHYLFASEAGQQESFF